MGGGGGGGRKRVGGKAIKKYCLASQKAAAFMKLEPVCRPHQKSFIRWGGTHMPLRKMKIYAIVLVPANFPSAGKLNLARSPRSENVSVM